MTTKKKASKPRSRRRPRFTGILAKPMAPPRPPPEYLSEEEALAVWFQQREDYLHAETMKRIAALLVRYDIDEEGRQPDAVLLDLVLALVEEFDVPGFRIAGDRPTGGRPRTWTFGAEARLLYLVADARTRNPRLSARGACMRLVAPGRQYSGQRGESLLRKYQEIKKKKPALVKMVELVAQGRSDEIQAVGFAPTIKVTG